MSKAKYYAVTLVRSLIGIEKKKKQLIQTSLGLRRRLQTVYRPVSPHVAGQILQVKELVKVELANEIPSKRQRPERGFKVIGKLTGLGEETRI